MLAALAITQGVRAWQAGGQALTIEYEAPEGALRITLRDRRDRLMRRVEFAAGVARRHQLELPVGRYQATLQVVGAQARRPRVQELVVTAQTTHLVVRW